MMAERVFQILAVILAGVAAYFLWTGNNDGAFISAVLGAVAFFLSIRSQVKDRNRTREAEREEAESRQDHDDTGNGPDTDPDEPPVSYDHKINGENRTRNFRIIGRPASGDRTGA